jgi:hypothetical protein
MGQERIKNCAQAVTSTTLKPNHLKSRKLSYRIANSMRQKPGKMTVVIQNETSALVGVNEKFFKHFLSFKRVVAIPEHVILARG